jgi:hypothetical protein
MPIDASELKGTERDGTKSNEYCKYCYQNGAFTDANITMDGMKTLVKEKMEERHIDKNIIQLSMNTIPNLKRWRS